MVIDNNTAQMSSLYVADSKVRSLTSAYQTTNTETPARSDTRNNSNNDTTDAYSVELSQRSRRLAEQEFERTRRAEELEFEQQQERDAEIFRQQQIREEESFNREQQQKQAEFEREQSYTPIDQVV